MAEWGAERAQRDYSPLMLQGDVAAFPPALYLILSPRRKFTNSNTQIRAQKNSGRV
jgi:hypothetical protein